MYLSIYVWWSKNTENVLVYLNETAHNIGKADYKKGVSGFHEFTHIFFC